MVLPQILRLRGLKYYTLGDYGRRYRWALMTPLFFLSPRLCYGWRNALLRLNGAQIARGVKIYPSVRIWQPWQLQIAANTVIGWDVKLYALGLIRLGPDCVVSQGCHLCAGTHDYQDPDFPLIKRPIVVGAGVWLAAEAFVGPGVTIGSDTVVGARSVVVNDLPAGVVAVGNPARAVKARNDGKTVAG